MHKISKEECRRLRAQFSCQENDREYLIRQNLVLKKEAAALQSQAERVRGTLEALTVERDHLAAFAAASAVPGGSQVRSTGSTVSFYTVSVERDQLAACAAASAARGGSQVCSTVSEVSLSIMFCLVLWSLTCMCDRAHACVCLLQLACSYARGEGRRYCLWLLLALGALRVSFSGSAVAVFTSRYSRFCLYSRYTVAFAYRLGCRWR